MAPNNAGPAIILASSSPYRRALLQRLALPFSCATPAIDEQQQPGEQAVDLVCRLAREKAGAVAAHLDSGLIIGSDQVAVLDNRILGKPLSHERAMTQLARASGQTVVFHTGICVHNAETSRQQCESIATYVRFRQLQQEEIERYLQSEQPYDCAGSFKSEGLGISLLEKINGDDTTALIGLPLIRLAAMLRNEGVILP